MRFEFDPAKSIANRRKHGIDFHAAEALWDDPNRIERPARSLDEARWQIIGRIQGKGWSAFVTYRHDETIRLISVRRTRPIEDRLYDGR